MATDDTTSPILRHRLTKSGQKKRKERGPIVDLIPEYTHYQDDGCEVAPSCLRCPLPRCRYDEPDGGRLLVKALRNQEIYRLHQEEGLVVGELARRFRLSKRSVHRILSSDPTCIGRTDRTAGTKDKELGASSHQ